MHHHTGHVHVEVERYRAHVHQFATCRVSKLDEDFVQRVFQVTFWVNEIHGEVLHLLRGERSAGGRPAPAAAAKLLPREESSRTKSNDEKHQDSEPHPAWKGRFSWLRAGWHRRFGGSSMSRLRLCWNAEQGELNWRSCRTRSRRPTRMSERRSQVSFAPEDINHGVEQQLQDSRCDDAANHWRGDAFHHVRAALSRRRPHDGKQTEQDGANRHDFRANALHCAFNNGRTQVVHAVH